MENENSTDMVVEYARYIENSKDIIRYNLENRIDGISINLSSKECEINLITQKTLPFRIEENSLWYRRGDFLFSNN